MKSLLVAALSAAVLVGCQSTGPKEGTGAVLGGVAGGLLGAQVGSGTGQLAATAAGAIGGLLLGQSIGRSLDEVDRMKAQQATHQALERYPTGSSSNWSNPDTGNSGAVTPVRTFQQADGTYCREFTQTVNVGGEVQEAYGTACRQPDGTWKITG